MEEDEEGKPCFMDTGNGQCMQLLVAEPELATSGTGA
jgi:hypothetical protein